MEFIDARRLTGPNVVFHSVGSILDVACTPDEADLLIPVWADNVGRMLEALDWPSAEFAFVKLQGGISLAFSAPVDQLYAASEINEWAWAASAFELGVSQDEPDFEETLLALQKSAAEEANVELMWLIDEAAKRGKTVLWDDDEVSLGLGTGSQTWPVREVPDAPDWANFHDVPIGIVTGTNGKTTTVRFAKHILRAAGRNVGVSSTDWIAVNERIIDRDDWSGPGGARAVLREKEVDAAILETARGGLLRRGLGVERADAALITNIAEDHLGDFGSRNLGELLAVKWVVSHAVGESGRLVLNAEDRHLVERAKDYDGEIVWFSLDPANEVVNSHVEGGGAAFVLDSDELLKIENGARSLLCRSHEIPITLGGAARHNIANALSAAALTWCLGTTRPPWVLCSIWPALFRRNVVPCVSARLVIVPMNLSANLREMPGRSAWIRYSCQNLRPTIAVASMAMSSALFVMSCSGRAPTMTRSDTMKKSSRLSRTRWPGRSRATLSSCWRWVARRLSTSASGSWALDKAGDGVSHWLCRSGREDRNDLIIA
jgi:hypothetical protein